MLHVISLRSTNKAGNSRFVLVDARARIVPLAIDRQLAAPQICDAKLSITSRRERAQEARRRRRAFSTNERNENANGRARARAQATAATSARFTTRREKRAAMMRAAAAAAAAAAAIARVGRQRRAEAALWTSGRATTLVVVGPNEGRGYERSRSRQRNVDRSLPRSTSSASLSSSPSRHHSLRWSQL